MGKEAAASEFEVKVQMRRGDVDHIWASSPVPPPQLSDHRRSLSADSLPFRRWIPWLVPTIVLANIVVFGVIMYVNDCPENTPGFCVGLFLGRFAFQPLKENPLLGPSSFTLKKMGALDVQKVVQEHQGWRLLVCIWLHAGVVHVLANMLSLLLIGIRLEQEFGFAKIGVLYIVSGFGGSLLSALFLKSTVSVGASGALFGLLGAMLSELLTNWTIYTNKLTALLTLVVIIALNLAVGILPHVDNFAHIGGFISGFFLGFVLLIRPQFGWVNKKKVPHGYIATHVKPKYTAYQYVLWTFATMFLIVGFTLGLVMLFRGVDANEYCSWCHYIHCVPTRISSCTESNISCLSSQDGINLNLKCGGSQRTQSYILPNATEFQIDELCLELCR